MLPGPLLVRRRHRREPQRAHPRRRVAGARDARGDARGGRRADPASCGRASSSTTTASSTASSRARLYTLPDEPPPILIAAAGEETARLARQDRRRLITTAPEKEVLTAFGRRKGPTASVRSPSAGRRTRRRAPRPPSSGGRRPRSPATTARSCRCPRASRRWRSSSRRTRSPSRSRAGRIRSVHLAKIQPYLDAGFDHVYLHQVGPDQEGFLRFAETELLPRLRGTRSKRRAA